jgi:hypothetical protein
MVVKDMTPRNFTPVQPKSPVKVRKVILRESLFKMESIVFSNDRLVTRQTEQQGRLTMIQKSEPMTPQEDGFNGHKLITREKSRTELPYLLPPNHTVPIWKIVGKFIQ